MRIHKLRSRLAAAASLGGVVLSATLMLGGGAASAISVPPLPTYNVYPNWLTSDGSVSHTIHATGSDTTFYVMQQLADLYNQAGLYGCTLVSTGSTQNQFCNNSSNTNTTTTNTVDNFDSNEALMGENDIGSGNGQQQLCGTQLAPYVVNFSRSSKPIAAISGCPMVETGFAKDSVPAVDFQNINPAAVGTASGYIGQTFTAPNQTFVSPPFPSTGIGPVAAGWLPGDPTNCVAAGTGSPACSGTAFGDVDAGTGQPGSVGFRLWCATDSTRITDWGQLTNLAGGKAVGSGTPIGVPIRIIGINKGSGTVATFNAFANSGFSGGAPNSGCESSPFNPNAASGPNPFTSDGYTGNLEIALENNASQIGDFAAANWPNDPADQAVDIATSLYYEGLGYYNTIPNASTAVLTPGTGTVPAGVPAAYTASLLNENNKKPTIPNERANVYATSRTLFNIYRSDQITSSTAGFLNWLCDSSSDTTTDPGLTGTIPKEKDQLSGLNFDNEITNTLNHFGFSRLDDLNSELTNLTPADGLVTPNATCDASLTVSSNGSNTVTDLAGTVPASIPSSGNWVATGTGVPSGTTVTSISGNTITLSNAVPTNASFTLYFPGHPPVLAVTDSTH
jgi:hypothetical protein